MKRLLVIAAVLLGLGIVVGAIAFIASTTAETQRNDDNAAAYDHAEKGAAYLKEHLYRAAINEFEAATKRSPGALDPWLGLAAAYIRLGNGAKALEGAGKAVDIAKDSAGAHLVLGRAHWLSRNLEDAEKAALKARELEDESTLQSAELLLRIYFDRHDDEKFAELLDSLDETDRATRELAVQQAVRRGEFRRAYDLQTRYMRRQLEAEVMRSQLALKREPGQYALYPALIHNLVTLGRPKEAIDAAREYRGDSQLDIDLGEAHWLAGNTEEARRCFERASAGFTHRLPAEIALYALTGEGGHWRAAFTAERLEKDYFLLAQLEDSLPKASPIQKAFIYRYAGLFDAELFEKSAEYALEVLKAEPDHFDALMTLGTAYLRLNRIDDAMRYVRQGSEKNPERAEVWARLGQLSLAKGDAAGAEPMLEKAVRLEPRNASYLYNYGWFLDQTERDAEAVPYYERAIAASSLSFEAMNNLALLEAMAGRPDKALGLLDRAITANPDNDAAFMNRGTYHAGRRSWRNALADYARAAELNPANGYARVEAARTHLELGRADIAIDELSQALESDPHLAEAYVLLAAAYKKDGQPDMATAAADEAKRFEAPAK